MTTIAFDGRYIACDSRISQDSRIVDDSCKKYIDTEGWVFFMAGNIAIQKDFVNCFLSGGVFDKKGHVGSLGFSKKDSKVYDFNHSEGQFDLCEIYHKEALGSGMLHAISAMDFGKSAVEAVMHAATRDMYTGGIIRCFDTHTGKFIKVKQ